MPEPLPETRRGYPGYRREGIVPSRPAKARFVRSRSFAIAYDDVGRGPVVVLVHGVTLSGGDWWETGAVDLLVGAGYRVLVVDPLGHGGSDRPLDHAAYLYPEVALDVAAAMDAARVDRAILWGYSRGALLATTLAIEVSGRVECLILGGYGGMEGMPPTELTDWQQGMLDGDWSAFWESPIGAGYAPADRRYAELTSDIRSWGAAMVSRRLHPYALRLDSVGCPVFAYGGGDDDADAASATAALLGTTPAFLPGLDHDTAVQEAGRVWEVVEPFLRSRAGTTT